MDGLNTKQEKEVSSIKEAVFAKMPEEKIIELQQEFNQAIQNINNYNFDM
jgi:hypothetical protein